MTDEEIIKLWKKGWSIERIANSFSNSQSKKTDTSSLEIFNKVETVVLNFLQKGE